MRGWMYRRASKYGLQKKKNSYPCWETNHGSSVVQTVSYSRYRLSPYAWHISNRLAKALLKKRQKHIYTYEDEIHFWEACSCWFRLRIIYFFRFKILLLCSTSPVSRNFWRQFFGTHCFMMHAVGHLIEALLYKPEGRRFDSRCFYWNFLFI